VARNVANSAFRDLAVTADASHDSLEFDLRLFLRMLLHVVGAFAVIALYIIGVTAEEWLEHKFPVQEADRNLMLVLRYCFRGGLFLTSAILVVKILSELADVLWALWNKVRGK
jgi:hypothetical protein